MARKKKTMAMAPMEYTPPTPQQQFDYAMRETVEKAVLAHPQTQKLRKSIEREMRKAAKAPSKKGM